MDFFLSCLLSQSNQAWLWHTFLDSVPLQRHMFTFTLYFTIKSGMVLAHISWQCSTAKPYVHLHIIFHQIFLLEYLALSIENVTSSDPIFVFLFRTSWFSSISCRCSQPASCSQSQYLLYAPLAHPSYSFWLDVSYLCSPTAVEFDLPMFSKCKIFS